jgi:hypothetical protein
MLNSNSFVATEQEHSKSDYSLPFEPFAKVPLELVESYWSQLCNNLKTSN